MWFCLYFPNKHLSDLPSMPQVHPHTSRHSLKKWNTFNWQSRSGLTQQAANNCAGNNGKKCKAAFRIRWSCVVCCLTHVLSPPSCSQTPSILGAAIVQSTQWLCCGMDEQGSIPGRGIHFSCHRHVQTSFGINLSPPT
jgi:hypothetical protein